MNLRPFLSVFFISLFTFNFYSFAQSEAALPFLTIPVSPLNAGMGNTGTSLPSNDVFGFISNPAQLGYLSQHTNLSLQLYPEESLIYDIISYNSFALNLGYNFENLIKFPLSLGIGYNRTKDVFKLLPDNEDKFDAFGFGFGVDFYVQFSAGYAYKNIYSKLGDLFGKASAEVSAYDIGFLLNVPVSRLLFQDENLNFISAIVLKPELNFSIGYAQSNIGDKIYYVDPAQADPLPRSSVLGYSVSAGLKEMDMKIPLEILHLDFSAEAKDYLINKDSIGTFSYQPSFGDINIGRNILGIKGDDKVYAQTGFKIELLETALLLYGHSGRSYGLSPTNGYGIRSRGLFKVIANNSKNRVINFLAEHLDITYYSSTYNVDTPVEISFKGLQISLSNFQF
jgi:hypothetical protein